MKPTLAALIAVAFGFWLALAVFEVRRQSDEQKQRCFDICWRTDAGVNINGSICCDGTSFHTCPTGAMDYTKGRCDE